MRMLQSCSERKITQKQSLVFSSQSLTQINTNGYTHTKSPSLNQTNRFEPNAVRVVAPFLSPCSPSTTLEEAPPALAPPAHCSTSTVSFLAPPAWLHQPLSPLDHHFFLTTTPFPKTPTTLTLQGCEACNFRAAVVDCWLCTVVFAHTSLTFHWTHWPTPCFSVDRVGLSTRRVRFDAARNKTEPNLFKNGVTVDC